MRVTPPPQKYVLTDVLQEVKALANYQRFGGLGGQTFGVGDGLGGGGGGGALISYKGKQKDGTVVSITFD